MIRRLIIVFFSMNIWSNLQFLSNVDNYNLFRVADVIVYNYYSHIHCSWNNLSTKWNHTLHRSAEISAKIYFHKLSRINCNLLKYFHYKVFDYWYYL